MGCLSLRVPCSSCGPPRASWAVAAPLPWGPRRAGSLCLRLPPGKPLHSRALPSPVGCRAGGALSQGETPTHPPIGLYSLGLHPWWESSPRILASHRDALLLSCSVPSTTQSRNVSVVSLIPPFPGKSPCLTQLPDFLAGQEGTDRGQQAAGPVPATANARSL